jgi:hypothetical protein
MATKGEYVSYSKSQLQIGLVFHSVDIGMRLGAWYILKTSEKLCHAEKRCHDHFLEDRGRDLSTKSGKTGPQPGTKDD